MRDAIKQCVRRVVAGASGFLPVAASCTRALTYHRFTDKSGLPDSSWVRHADFARQMSFIAQACEPVSERALFSSPLDTGTSHPRVCVTIDDGHVSALTLAAPVLTRLEIPAILFIPTDTIGARDCLSRAHIRELSDAGFTIGSHSCSHRSITSLDASELRVELTRSKAILEDLTGAKVDAFAYPFGTRSDFSQTTAQALERAGYRIAFTSQHGALLPAANPLCLPRVKVEGNDPFWLFRGAVSGRLDSWALVDRCLWWLQRGAHRRNVASHFREAA
jgi:peptidoglycan/xylan/chitin deacetylase (PgdA/CDA1 family)